MSAPAHFATDALLDRLVDGELPAAERREVLARLDDEPHGWRRLALAFVESQTWRRELTALADGALLGNCPTSTAMAPAAATSPASSRWSKWLAMAAAVLLAFAGGVAVRDRGLPAWAGFGAPTEDWAWTGTERSRPASESPDMGQVVSADGPPRLTLYNAAGQPIELPLLEASQAGAELWQQPAELVPRNVREALRRSGYEIEQQRQLLPFDLHDGRRIVVPVDSIDLRFDGEPEWQ